MDICVLALSKVCIIYIAYIYSKESDYNKFYKLINFFFIFLIEKHWNYTMEGVFLGHIYSKESKKKRLQKIV
jgi:hypothetical protein